MEPLKYPRPGGNRSFHGVSGRLDRKNRTGTGKPLPKNSERKVVKYFDSWENTWRPADHNGWLMRSAMKIQGYHNGGGANLLPGPGKALAIRSSTAVAARAGVRATTRNISSNYAGAGAAVTAGALVGAGVYVAHRRQKNRKPSISVGRRHYKRDRRGRFA